MAMQARAENAAERLERIRQKINRAVERFDTSGREVALVAVSKTFSADDITPLLDAGQRIFGENRVQEAKDKWPELQKRYPGVELHLIGPLQTNKVREAVALFDVIESLDREKLAAKLSAEMTQQGRKLPCFIQVNIGEEAQKAGIAPDQAVAFVEKCRTEHKLDIVGLMCIPPAGLASGPFFARLAGLAREAGLEKLSMGMSADFETAVEVGASHVRVGSALFGGRLPQN